MIGGGKTGAGQRVLVIGGGLIGAASAVRLRQAGAEVVLVDPGDERARASWGNATLIATELAEPLASWSTLRSAPRRLFAFGGPLDFVWRDISLWLPWSLRYLAACRLGRFQAGTAALSALLQDAAPTWRRLAQDIGRPELFQNTPHWAVWESEPTLRSGVAAVRAADLGAARLRELASQEVEAVRREVSSRIAGGVCYEATAKIADSGAAVRALRDALEGAGGEWREDRVLNLALGGGGVEAMLAGGDRIEADLALVAAGARSAVLLRPLGLTSPLAAERGYHLQYDDHGLAPGAPPLIFEDRFICVVRVGEAVRITGFTEVGRPDTPSDPRKWARLERHVRELGLPVRGEPERWMGARPSLPDFLPAIGRSGPILYAFGHQHIGLTLAAVTADWVARLAQLAQDSHELELLKPFSLARFG